MRSRVSSVWDRWQWTDAGQTRDCQWPRVGRQERRAEGVAHHRSAQPCGEDDLRTLLLFDGLTDEQVTQLCTNARIEVFEAGRVVEEGQDARRFLVLMDGE